jgi:flagellar hook-associated protein 2
MAISPVRMTGMATGMDTDATIKQMLKPYQMRVDKVKQDRQIIQWRQELYRDILKEANNFTRNYFDVLKKDSYMLSKNIYSPFAVEGLSGNGLSVTASSSAKAGEYKINVTQLAEGPKVEGTNIINTTVAGEPNYGIKIDKDNNKFEVILADGPHSIEIPINSVSGYNKYNNISEVANAINNELKEENLSDKVKAVVKDGNIQVMTLTKVEENKSFTFTVDGNPYDVAISPGNYTSDELAAQLTSKISPSLGKSIIAETTNGGTTFKVKNNSTGVIEGPIEVKYDNNALNIEISEFNASNANIYLNNTDIIKPLDVDGAMPAKNSISFKKEVIKGFNDTISIRIGTDVKTIELEATGVGQTETNVTLTSKIEAALRKNIPPLGDPLVSSEDLTVDITDDGKIRFISKSGKQISIYGNGSSVLGASDNFEINMKSTTKMSNIINGNVEFRIKDVVFKYDFDNDAKDKTIDQILRDIKTKTGVDISYSESTKKFTLSSSDAGANSNVYIEDLGGTGFLKTILGDNVFGGAGTSKSITGKDAQFTLTDPTGKVSTYAKSQNNFTIDGVNYNLNAKTTGEITFNLTTNPDDAVKKIMDFVNKYNEMIDKINTKISEKRQYTFLPLTEEQKKEMSEDEIKKWEEKAKEGLLKGDSELSNMVNSMRSAFFAPVKGVALNLKEIGFDTSSDYSQQGKIVVDQDKLKQALKNKGNEVSEFFGKQSETHSTYSSTLKSDQRKIRNEEQGVFQRINDILKDYTRTTDGKGALLKKAGIQGDLTDKKNTLTEYMQQKDKVIKEMERKLSEREKRLYNQFAQLEKAMNQMNAQSSWLAQQLGGGK